MAVILAAGADGFLPHAVCYLWDRGLLSLHAVTDILIGLSYVAISTTLVVLVMQARRDIPFHWVFIAFGTFIVACGATHLMEVWTLWSPAYWTAGGVKALTAIASVATALILPPLVPKALELVRNAKLREELYQEQAARADAEAANRAKDQFLATLSHELRTPINAVYGWARLLRAGGVPAEDVAKGLEAIERNAQAQVRLIEDLLDISRIVAGKMQIDVRPVDLRGIVRAALDSVGPAVKAKDLTIAQELDPAASMIAGDPDRLQQVVWNLLANAVKFTPPGGRITIALRPVDHRVELSVADTGQGIPGDVLPFVFERFRQAEGGSTRRHGGLGIGLALVRHLVEMHGGDVRAESAGPGRGATFTVRLRARSDQAVGGVPGIAVAPSAVGSVLERQRVLVVDDDLDSLALARTMLSRHGADVRTASDAASAAALVDSWRPHVVLCDIEMPGEDGYAFIARLRARGDRTPAAAFTAYGGPQDRARSAAAGFDMHIAKPVDPDVLARIVGDLTKGERKG